MQKKAEQEESKKENEPGNALSKNSNDNNAGKSNPSQLTADGSINELISAGKHINDLTQLSGIRRKMKAESIGLKSEIKMNRSHLEGDPNRESIESRSEMRMNSEITVNKSKADKSTDIEGRISRLDLRIGEGLSSVHHTSGTVQIKEDEAANSKRSPQKIEENSTDGEAQASKNNTAFSIDVRV